MDWSFLPPVVLGAGFGFGAGWGWAKDELFFAGLLAIGWSLSVILFDGLMGDAYGVALVLASVAMAYPGFKAGRGKW
jgi:hypothetical protein